LAAGADAMNGRLTAAKGSFYPLIGWLGVAISATKADRSI
jgi:hypothetical protein